MRMKKTSRLLILPIGVLMSVSDVTAKELPNNFSAGHPFLTFATGAASEVGEFDELSDAPGWTTSAERLISSPDEKLEVRLSEDRTKLVVSDRKTKEVVFERKNVPTNAKPAYASMFWSVSWSPDSKNLIFTDFKGGHILNLKKKKSSDCKELPFNAHGCDWSKSTDRIAILGYGKDEFKSPPVLQIYDWKNKKVLFEESSELGNRLAWSPDGKLLAINVRDSGVKIFDSEQDWKSVVFGEDSVRGVGFFAWSPDSTKIALTKFKDLKVFDVKSGKQVFQKVLENPRDVSWSADGKTILCRYCFNPDDYYKVNVSEIKVSPSAFPNLPQKWNKIFSSWLTIIEEPLLQERSPTQTIIFRIIAISAFKDSVCLRVELSGDTANLTVKRKEKRSQAQPLDFTVIEVSEPIELSPIDVTRLQKLIEDAKPELENLTGSPSGFDGTNYLFELYEKGQRKYAERWSPSDCNLIELNSFLLSLSNNKSSRPSKSKGLN